MPPAMTLKRTPEELTRRVIDRTLEVCEWTHEAHVAVCLTLVKRHPHLDVETELPNIIRAYNLSVGTLNTDQQGFHATITEFFVRVVRAFVALRPVDEPLERSLKELLATKETSRAFPLEYYSRERLFSVDARRAWVAPDLKPLMEADLFGADRSRRVAATSSKTALIIVDMQRGSVCESSPKYDSARLIERLNLLSQRVRLAHGLVLYVQQDGPEGDDHFPGLPGWELLPELDVQVSDRIVRKTCCDAFLGTCLADVLDRANIEQIIITGCSTDVCIDTTVRSALGRGYRTIVPEDGHTTSDRPHLSATDIITHHNWVWERLMAPNGPAIACSCDAVRLGH
jgi:nicotinamidase-related amidase